MSERSRVAAGTAGLPQGLTVVFGAFLPILAIMAMFPALPVLIEHFRDVPGVAIKVPSMVSAPGLTVAVLSLFVGVLIDRFGRRRLLLVATFLYGIFGALPYLLDTLDSVYASRLLLGVAEAVILTTLNTMWGDYWTGSARRNWLTFQGLVGPALSALVIYFSGSLAAWRWNAPFLLYLVAFPIFAATYLWVFEPRGHSPDHDGGRGASSIPTVANFPWRAVAGIGAVALFTSTLYFVFIVHGSLVWQELGIVDAGEIGRISSIPSLFVLMGAAVYWVLGRLGVGSALQLTTFLGLIGVGLVIMGTAGDRQGMIIGMIVQQTGQGMAVPVSIAWAQQHLPFEHRGRGMGAWTACFFLGQFMSPLVVGLIRGGNGTMQGAFQFVGIVAMAGACALWFLLTRWQPDDGARA